MENSKTPLPEEMDHIDSNMTSSNDSDDQDNQLVDLDNQCYTRLTTMM